MSVMRMQRGTIPDRLALLEKRADGHDQVIPPMAAQVKEVYDLLTRWRNINWFLVKVFAAIGAALGFVAVVLTIASALKHLFGAH